VTTVICKQLRHLFTVTTGATPESGNADYWDGDILWATPEDVSSLDTYWLNDTRRKITRAGYESCGTTLAPSKSILLSKRAPIGQLAILAKEACSNQGCFLLVPRRETDTRFFYYWLSAQTAYLQVLGRGSTFMELSTDELKSLVVPEPILPVQRAIADYLDRETARLDALVAAKERLLGFLAEKRRALITRAVTRGLDSHVPLHDSGNPALGEIPATWTSCHLKRVLARMDYGISEPVNTTGNVAVLRMGDIQDGEIDYSKVGFVDFIAPSLLLQPGDLVFNRTNSLDQIGKVAVFRGKTEYPVSFASYLVRFRCGPKVLPEYLNWLLNSAFPVAWGRAEALPAIGQANLNPNRYSYLPIALPPLAVQQEIIEYLAEVTARFDAVRTATHRTIRLLKERRAALISAAVTGQIDVRVAA
jgi:type I restriction enzyme S subunit